MVKAVRAAQVADQIRDYVAGWSAQDLHGYFFSITQVTLEPDMQSAVLWVDVLQPDQETLIIRRLQKLQGEYQRKLQKSMQRNTIPRIAFKLDERPSLNQRFDDLLKG